MRSIVITASVVLTMLAPFIAHAGVVKQTKLPKQNEVTQKKVTDKKAQQLARKAAMEVARKVHKESTDVARTKYTEALKAARVAKSKEQMKSAKNTFESAKKTVNEKLKTDLEAAKAMQ